MLLGISIFLAVSVITALLERHLPSVLQYLFQVAAVAGLAELLLSQELAGAIRVWAGIVYLSFALSSLVAVNIRLAIIRREMNVASIFSQLMTVPVIMISALFLSSFLQNGGELVFSLASIVTIAVAVLVASLSVFGLLREYRRGSARNGGLVSFPTGPNPISSAGVGPSLESRLGSDQRDDWEESSTNKKDQ